MLLYLTRDEIDKRWASTILGKAWNILYPLLFLGMYATVYMFIFKIRMGEMAGFEYTLLIFCGLVPYFCLAEALTYGSTSLTGNSQMLKNLSFPVELIPVRDVLVAFLGMVFSFIPLMLCVLFMGKLTFYALFIFPTLLLHLLFTVGTVWFLSVLAVFIRDIKNIVNVVTLFLLFASPFAYTPDMVPSHMKFILYLNPMYYLVELYRQPLFYGQSPGLKIFLIFCVISIFLFLAGHLFIRRFKSRVVDHV